MSIIYSTRVFYGTCVPRYNAVGRALEHYINEHGGSPAPTGTNGVVIGTAGDDEHPLLTIEFDNNERWSHDRSEGLAGFASPTLITAAPLYWTNWLRDFIAAEKLPTATIPPIGFYIVGTIS